MSQCMGTLSLLALFTPRPCRISVSAWEIYAKLGTSVFHNLASSLKTNVFLPYTDCFPDLIFTGCPPCPSLSHHSVLLGVYRNLQN